MGLVEALQAAIGAETAKTLGQGSSINAKAPIMILTMMVLLMILFPAGLYGRRA